MAGVGIASYQKLPIDAVPDITNVQVQINSAAAGFSPLETEQRITFPIETAMAGLPGLQQTRSLSRSGLSQVTVIFGDGTDLFFARQLVNERLQVAREQLPDGIETAMGPISTGLGKFSCGPSKPRTARAKRTAPRTPHRPAGDPGLDHQTATAQRAGRGRDQYHWRLRQEYQIAPDPKRLAAYNLTSTIWSRRWSVTTPTSAPVTSSAAANSC